MGADAGFREVDHTADWAIEVWAPDLEGLLEQSAAGIYEMSGLEFGSELHVSRTFAFEFEDRETLLVQFLSELNYLLQTEHIAFHEFDVTIPEERGGPVSVSAVGDPVAGIDKEIKAVTWYGLDIRETEDGYHGQVTFDV